MSTALSGVQKSVYAKLSEDYILSTFQLKVYDEVPENAAFPYVVIGDATETPMDSFGRKGRKPSITIELYSQYFGYKEILSLIGQVDLLLNRANLLIENYESVYCMISHIQVERESDGLTRRAMMHFEIYAEEVI